MNVLNRVEEITQLIIERSKPTRTRYLQSIVALPHTGPRRQALDCTNQAHGFAAC